MEKSLDQMINELKTKYAIHYGRQSSIAIYAGTLPSKHFTVYISAPQSKNTVSTNKHSRYIHLM